MIPIVPIYVDISHRIRQLFYLHHWHCLSKQVVSTDIEDGRSLEVLKPCEVASSDLPIMKVKAHPVMVNLHPETHILPGQPVSLILLK